MGMVVPVASSRRSRFEAIIGELAQGVCLEESTGLESLVNWSAARTTAIHRWFRYREGFSPRLIEALGLGQNLLDPFCGSGSILVGAAQGCRTALGIDINPLATFVAKVKITPLSRLQLIRVSEILDRVDVPMLSGYGWSTPGLTVISKVFEPDILRTLLQLRGYLEIESRSDPATRAFLLLAWLAILEQVGSYFKEGNGIKYRNRKRVRAGYVRRPEGSWQLERFGPDQSGFVLSTFRSHLRLMLEDTALWTNGTWSAQKVMTANALDEMDSLEEGSFDGIVFSPPYANRFDYFESLKVELWLGNFVESREDMALLRRSSLRSHLSANMSQGTYSSPILEDLIHQIDPHSSAWRMNIAVLLRGYFEDMRRIIVACRRALRVGSPCHIVVGNSAYGGAIIPTDLLIAQLGLQNGFSNCRVRFVRHLSVAPQQRSQLTGYEHVMRESVVTLW